MSQAQAKFLILTCALLWSIGGVLIKFVPWPGLCVAGVRSFIAGVVLLAVFSNKINFSFSRFKTFGAFLYAATVVLFVVATKKTTAANAVLLQYTAPMHIALFAPYFLKEKTSKGDWMLVGVMMVGMTLFFYEHISLEHKLGNILALCSGLTFAWMTMTFRKLQTPDILFCVIVGNGLAALFCLPALGGITLEGRPLIILLVLGCIQMALPYYLYTKAIVHVGALDAMLIKLIEPLCNPIWVLLFFGEKPGVFSILGGAVVLGALVVSSAINRRA